MNKIIALIFSSIILFEFGYSQKVKSFETFNTESKSIFDFCFTKKGGAIVIADNQSVKLFSVKNKSLLRAYNNGHKDRILAIDISKDSSLIVSGGRDSTIVLWDLISGKVLKTLRYQKGIISSLKISADCKYLVSGGSDKNVFLYDLKNNKILYELGKHSDDITSVAFSPDCKTIAATCADHFIYLYAVESGKLISKLEGHTNCVREAIFSADSSKLISCGDDSKVIFWNITDLHSPMIAIDFRIGKNWILSVDLNQDNKTYVTGNINGKALIFSQFKTYKLKLGIPINKILFIPNKGPFLKVVAATQGKGVFLVDAINMK